ncbi:MAG: B12-binding domain-containing radical SAM protein [Candidatus Omnitrophica bacterium]|nr:B12-binding domain-containing radical SAM protein [Candidatus Omnitrophota bacterium]
MIERSNKKLHDKRMRVVLINPIASEDQLQWIYKKLFPPVPPTGLCYIAAMLDASTFDVHIIDQFALHLTNEQVLERIKDINPSVVGFSCLTSAMNNVKKITRCIRLRHKNILILLGNLHATLYAHELLEENVADIIVHGEGEVTCREVLSLIHEGKRYDAVLGISYRNKGHIYTNVDRNPVRSLDELPYPAWNLLDLQLYNHAPLLALREISLPVFASRGCAFNCTFCAQNKIFKSMRIREIHNVIDEIEYMYTTMGVKSFVFCDSIFPFVGEKGLLFCHEYKARGLHNKIKLTIEMRINQVDETLMKELKEIRVHLIMFGVESGNERLLHAMGKKETVTQIKESITLVKKAGIMTLGFFMIGMPDETIESYRETVRFAKELDCDMVKFNIMIPYPGTALYEQYKERISSQCSFEDYSSWDGWLLKKRQIPVITKHFHSDEILTMQQKAMFSYYMRPQIIARLFMAGAFSLKNFIIGGCFLIYRFVQSYLGKKNMQK